MPDYLGTAYEGVFGALARSAGFDITYGAPEGGLVSTCLDVCEFGEACRTDGIKPRVRVEPDVLLWKGGRIAGIACVTHWRTLRYTKKSWRTWEEVFEHKLFLRPIMAVNVLMEPVASGVSLVEASRLLLDVTVDPTGFWDKGGQEFADAVRLFVESRATTSHEDVEEWVRCRKGFHGPALRYLHLLEARVKEDLTQARCRNPGGLWDVATTNCRRAMQRRSSFEVMKIGRRRTAVQMLTLLMASAQVDGVSLDFDTLVRRGACTTSASAMPNVEALSKIPIRVRGQSRTYFFVCTKRIGGHFAVKLTPNGREFCAGDAGLVASAKRYLAFCRSDKTWDEYVDVLSSPASLQASVQSEVQSKDEVVTAALKKMRIGEHWGWILGSIAYAAGISTQDTESLIDTELAKHDLTANAVAPFPNSGQNVNWAFQHFRTDLLRVTGLDVSATVWSVVQKIYEDLAAQTQMDLPAILEEGNLFRMRSFLARAPHPAIALVRSIAEELGFEVDGQNRLESTLINTTVGGKGGKTGYELRLRAPDGSLLFVKLSTGQEGNQSHKWKELSARIRAHRIRMDDERRFGGFLSTVWLVLDGDWPEDDQLALVEAGFDRVFGVGQTGELRAELSCWLAERGAG